MGVRHNCSNQQKVRFVAATITSSFGRRRIRFAWHLKPGTNFNQNACRFAGSQVLNRQLSRRRFHIS